MRRPFTRNCLIGLTVLSFAGGTAFAAPPATPSTQPAVTLSEKKLSDISDLLAANSNQKALTTALAAQKSAGPIPPGQISDPLLIRLFDLTALCQLKLNQTGPAQKSSLRAFNSPKTSRSIVLNLATAEMQMKSYVIHSVDVLANYCDAHPEDNEAMDLYGVAIDKAVKAKTLAKPIKPYIDRYVALVPKLEATKPNQRRWGTKWVSPSEYQSLKDKQDFANRRVTNQQHEVDSAQEEVDHRQRDLDEKRRENFNKPLRYQSNLNWEIEQLESAKSHLTTEQNELTRRQKDVPMPEWNASLTGVASDSQLADK